MPEILNICTKYTYNKHVGNKTHYTFMVDYHGIPLEISWIMTITITIHDMLVMM